MCQSRAGRDMPPLAALVLVCLVSVAAKAQPSEASRSTGGPPDDSAHAGWTDADGFYIQSSDGNHRLRIGAQLGLRFQPAWTDGEPRDRTPRYNVRPELDGWLFRPWLQWNLKFQLEKDAVYVLDAFIDLAFDPAFKLKWGQFRTPFDRHEDHTASDLLFADFAPVANYFWTSRDKGAMAHGALASHKLQYFIGVFMGSPANQAASLSESWQLNARIHIDPFGPVAHDEIPYITAREAVPWRVSWALNGYLADVKFPADDSNPSFEATGSSSERRRQQAAALDMAVQGGRFVFFAEGYVRHDIPDRRVPDASKPFFSTGFWGQLGVGLWPRTLDAAARVNWLRASDRLDHATGYSVEGQLGYYPFQSHRASLKLRYGYVHQASPGSDALGSSVHLLFPDAVGNTHLVTVQLYVDV